jgi:hypothetical protein
VLRACVTPNVQSGPDASASQSQLQGKCEAFANRLEAAIFGRCRSSPAVVSAIPVPSAVSARRANAVRACRSSELWLDRPHARGLRDVASPAPSRRSSLHEPWFSGRDAAICGLPQARGAGAPLRRGCHACAAHQAASGSAVLSERSCLTGAWSEAPVRGDPAAWRPAACPPAAWRIGRASAA